MSKVGEKRKSDSQDKASKKRKDKEDASLGNMYEARNHFFTWNHKDKDMEYIKACGEKLKNWARGRKNLKIMFQLEKGDKEGTYHHQGVISSTKSPIWDGTLKRKFKGIWLQKCKSVKHAIKYCSKMDTKAGKIFNLGFKIIKDPLEGKEYYPWQKDVKTIVESEPDDRHVYWIWDKNGQNGKTHFPKHLAIKFPELKLLYVSGDGKDIKFAVAKMDPKVVVWNVAKAEERIGYVTVEQVKDGIFFVNKYESGQFIGNPPHIIIFANRRPEKWKLSADRWKIYRINDKRELIEDVY